MKVKTGKPTRPVSMAAAGYRMSRREWITKAGLVLGSVGVGGGSLAGDAGRAHTASENTSVSEPRRWHELGIIGDDYLDAQLLRQLEAIWHGMGDIGEVLDTASRVRPGDPNSWFDEWYATAQRVHALAWETEQSGHAISAGEAYLRASNYYRGAEWFDHNNDAAQRHTETFQRALKLLSIPAVPVEIPYEGTTLPGYFFRSQHAGKKAPLLIAHSGFDGTTEEMKFVGEGAVKRGYHALLFTGPGQGLVVRKQGLRFRPDWEKVISPVIDFAEGRDEVDGARIGLLGHSFGGFLAPRAAAFDNRLKALVTNPGVLNFYSLARAYFGEDNIRLATEAPGEFDEIMYQRMRHNLRIRMSLSDSMLKFGARTPAELPGILQEFDNTGIVHRIQCSTLIMDGTEDSVNGAQAMALYEALDCPKEYILFAGNFAGSLHCQTGALALSNQCMFDWLDNHLMG